MNQKDGLEEKLFKGQDYVILFLAALSSSFSDSYFFIGSQVLTWNSESVMTPMVDCLRAIVGRTTGSHLNIKYRKIQILIKIKNTKLDEIPGPTWTNIFAHMDI